MDLGCRPGKSLLAFRRRLRLSFERRRSAAGAVNTPALAALSDKHMRGPPFSPLSNLGLAESLLTSDVGRLLVADDLVVFAIHGGLAARINVRGAPGGVVFVSGRGEVQGGGVADAPVPGGSLLAQAR